MTAKNKGLKSGVLFIFVLIYHRYVHPPQRAKRKQLPLPSEMDFVILAANMAIIWFKSEIRIYMQLKRVERESG
jgi:hypothetical protein